VGVEKERTPLPWISRARGGKKENLLTREKHASLKCSRLDSGPGGKKLETPKKHPATIFSERKEKCGLDGVPTSKKKREKISKGVRCGFSGEKQVRALKRSVWGDYPNNSGKKCEGKKK